MNDIYAAPEADLETIDQGDRFGGTIEDSLAGENRIGVGEILGEGWRAMKGFKLTCHIAFVVYIVAAIVVMIVAAIPIGFLVGASGADSVAVNIIASITQTIASLIIMPIFFGIHIMAIRHIAQRSTPMCTMFQFFGKIPRLLLTYLIMSVLIVVGLIFLILPGIYLMVAYIYAMPLVVEKDMKAWEALETSRKIITKNWFPVFGIMFLLMLANMLTIFTLGIAMIWTLPWAVIAFALIHVKLFGAEAHTLAE
jgi:uncharacterized membrane protein